MLFVANPSVVAKGVTKFDDNVELRNLWIIATQSRSYVHRKTESWTEEAKATVLLPDFNWISFWQPPARDIVPSWAGGMSLTEPDLEPDYPVHTSDYDPFHFRSSSRQNFYTSQKVDSSWSPKPTVYDQNLISKYAKSYKELKESLERLERILTLMKAEKVSSNLEDRRYETEMNVYWRARQQFLWIAGEKALEQFLLDLPSSIHSN